MNSKIMIKSFSNGLKVFLDSECPFDEIIDEAKEKFSSSKDFFKGGKIVVSYEGRDLNKEEELRLTRTIEAFGAMTILYLICKDKETEEIFTKVVSRPVPVEESSLSIGRIYAGSLKKGDKLDCESSIVILGDVEPGATITSNGNIIVMGGLYGTAICTAENEVEKCFIAAMDVSAEKIQIGVYHYFSKERAKWVVKPKMVSKIAYVDNKSVSLEPISKSALTNLCNIINR